jgi:hypothetical protein
MTANISLCSESSRFMHRASFDDITIIDSQLESGIFEIILMTSLDLLSSVLLSRSHEVIPIKIDIKVKECLRKVIVSLFFISPRF